MDPNCIEKAVIAFSFVAAIPLFFLDANRYELRRYAWLIAICSGFSSLLFPESKSDVTGVLDKITVAALSISSVPHFHQLMTDSPWVGYSTIPLLFVASYLSATAEVGSEQHWQLRAFLHMTVIMVPYLNHLPSERPKTGTQETIVNLAGSATDPQANPTTTSASKSTANKRKGKKKNRKD